jgi:hypothetical protein
MPVLARARVHDFAGGNCSFKLGCDANTSSEKPQCAFKLATAARAHVAPPKCHAFSVRVRRYPEQLS